MDLSISMCMCVNTDTKYSTTSGQYSALDELPHGVKPKLVQSSMEVLCRRPLRFLLQSAAPIFDLGTTRLIKGKWSSFIVPWSVRNCARLFRITFTDLGLCWSDVFKSKDLISTYSCSGTLNLGFLSFGALLMSRNNMKQNWKQYIIYNLRVLTRPCAKALSRHNIRQLICNKRCHSYVSTTQES